MNIIITGGSKGIGLETARVLAENKENRIIITGRSRKLLDGIVSSFPNGNLTSIEVDLASSDSLNNYLLSIIKQHFNTIDILINNAGYLHSALFDELAESETRMMMEVNFFAPVKLIRLLLPLMHKGSHILNISSMGGYQGSTKFPGLSCYSASKAAIACLTECLAVEFSGNGISVNCLAPGSVDTDMFREAFPVLRANMSPSDMGKFVAWFALNGNRYFNGKILPVALVAT